MCIRDSAWDAETGDPIPTPPLPENLNRLYERMESEASGPKPSGYRAEAEEIGALLRSDSAEAVNKGLVRFNRFKRVLRDAVEDGEITDDDRLTLMRAVKGEEQSAAKPAGKLRFRSVRERDAGVDPGPGAGAKSSRASKSLSLIHI